MVSRVKANSSGTIGIAAVYVALGDKDAAFRILQKAVEERQPIVALKEDPLLENLRSDPRWKVLLRRMNYPEEQYRDGTEAQIGCYFAVIGEIRLVVFT